MRYRRQKMEDLGKGDEREKPSLRRRRRGVRALPTLFTLGNCLCGFASLYYASRMAQPGSVGQVPSDHAIAGYFLFAAMLFDMFDGFVARLTKSASTFGAELDSLADMVSFGVAPAFLALNVIDTTLRGQDKGYWEFVGPNAVNPIGKLFWVIGAIYVACTALRLARFNVKAQSDEGSHMVFQGMPSPGAAGVVAASIIFFETLNLSADQHRIWFNVAKPLQESLKIVFAYSLPGILLVSALLMVSGFAYTHLINRFLRGRKRFRDVVFLFLLVMLLVWQPQITTLATIYLYAVSAPFMAVYRKVFPKAGAVATPPASSGRP